MTGNRVRIVMVGLLLLAGGRSGGQEKAEAPAVASLSSAAARNSAPVVKAEQPVIPIDATDEDIKALAQPWIACLVKEGNGRFEYSEDAWQLLYKLSGNESEPALRKCVAKMPETAQKHLKRTDLPAYKDNQREFYRCAQREGYKLTAPDPETGEFGLASIGPDGDASSPTFEKCERDAFAS